MQILKMYSIYDRKSKIHHPPNYCHNTAHAMRVFTSIFSQVEQVFNAYPEDFQIFEIGEWNDETGMVTSLDKAHLICSGTDLMPLIPKTDPLQKAGPLGMSDVDPLKRSN